jgi:hypothetical protein
MITSLKITTAITIAFIAIGTLAGCGAAETTKPTTAPATSAPAETTAPTETVTLEDGTTRDIEDITSEEEIANLNEFIDTYVVYMPFENGATSMTVGGVVVNCPAEDALYEGDVAVGVSVEYSDEAHTQIASTTCAWGFVEDTTTSGE